MMSLALRFGAAVSKGLFSAGKTVAMPLVVDDMVFKGAGREKVWDVMKNALTQSPTKTWEQATKIYTDKRDTAHKAVDTVTGAVEKGEQLLGQGQKIIKGEGTAREDAVEAVKSLPAKVKDAVKTKTEDGDTNWGLWGTTMIGSAIAGLFGFNKLSKMFGGKAKEEKNEDSGMGWLGKLAIFGVVALGIVAVFNKLNLSEKFGMASNQTSEQTIGVALAPVNTSTFTAKPVTPPPAAVPTTPLARAQVAAARGPTGTAPEVDSRVDTLVEVDNRPSLEAN